MLRTSRKFSALAVALATLALGPVHDVEARTSVSGLQQQITDLQDGTTLMTPRLDDSLDCFAPQEGLLAWDSSRQVMQVCNGLDWQDVAIDTRPIMLSAICSGQATGTPGSKYCLDTIDIDTVQPHYLTFNSSGDITVATSGYYRFNYFGLQRCEEGASRSIVLVNSGSSVRQKNFEQTDSGSSLASNSVSMDVIVRANEGDVLSLFFGVSGGSCQYVYNGFQPLFSNFQVTYEGPL